MEHAVLFLSLACIFGFFMAWGIGANDVSNAMGTSVGSKALTFFQATIVAAIFEAAGSILAGGQVTSTIRGDIISTQMFVGHPNLLVYGMLSSLLAASIWLVFASYKSLPVSTTHTIVGAIVGFAAINVGWRAVHWEMVAGIASSWVVTPFISGVIAFIVFKTIQNLILDTDDPFNNAKRYSPVYIFLVTFIIAMVTLTKGMAHLNIHLNATEDVVIALIAGIIAMLPIAIILRRMQPTQKEGAIFNGVEKMFAILQIFTACCMAFAHGSNDVANAIGPLAAVVSIVKTGTVLNQSALPIWILILGAVGIVIGLATYGYKVIRTIGTHITELTPTRGFSAEFSTAATVVIASGIGLPVSTTQTLVGAVFGVGFARGIGALNLKTIRSIFMSWVITLPAGAILSAVIFMIFKAIFNG